MKNVNFLLHLAILFSVFFFTESRSIKIPWPQQSHKPFKPKNNTENAGSCSYSVSITTSCSSPRYTRDQISLAFGDAYGKQVYAPRIDNPSARAFESCSTDTFEISGPCTYQVCYVYLYRNGYDGWKTQTVTIYGHYTKSVTFYYNSFIPNGVWYGFNQCNSASESSVSSSM